MYLHSSKSVTETAYEFHTNNANFSKACLNRILQGKRTIQYTLEESAHADVIYHIECMTNYYTHHRSCLYKKKHGQDKVGLSCNVLPLLKQLHYVMEDDIGGPFYTTLLAHLYQAKLTKADKKLCIVCEAANGKKQVMA